MSAKKNEIDGLSYLKVLEQIKDDIQQSQLRAALSNTKELTMLYWRIGKMISEKVSSERWGSKTIERLAKDLKNEFPNVSGFSIRNLQYMRKFASSYSEENYAAAAAQIPWGHNMLILDKVEGQKNQK
jgi:predicted nuclease of restriction endonuclease-like (RecB) superfamily